MIERKTMQVEHMHIDKLKEDANNAWCDKDESMKSFAHSK